MSELKRHARRLATIAELNARIDRLEATIKVMGERLQRLEAARPNGAGDPREGDEYEVSSLIG